jgi:hypothetical protein
MTELTRDKDGIWWAAVYIKGVKTFRLASDDQVAIAEEHVHAAGRHAPNIQQIPIKGNPARHVIQRFLGLFKGGSTDA